MARRPAPDWSEEELQEKLNALRGRSGRKAQRLEQNLQRHGIELNHDPQYVGLPEFELDDPTESSDDGPVLAYIDSLTEAEDWETLEQYAKQQASISKQQLKVWRKLIKGAGKRRRAERPLIIRGIIRGLKYIGVFAVVSLSAGVIVSIFHH